MPAHLLSLVDTEDFGSDTIRIGDLNNDGAPELLLIQSFRPTREISCLTAADIYGNIIWQKGNKSEKNCDTYADLPVQIYDWDNDGLNEVLWIEQADYLEFEAHSYNPSDEVLLLDTKNEVRHDKERYVERASAYGKHATMHVLEGSTGREKYSFPIPAPADDSFLFANLTGQLRKEDLIVKDRYWNMWGISHNSEVLWQWNGSTGHYPAVGDLDGDGRDEVFTGFALVDHDGRELWSMDNNYSHADATYIAESNGETRLFFGNHGLHCHNVAGKELWYHPIGEAQHVLAACFRPDLGPMQIAVIVRGQIEKDTKQSRFDANDLYYGVYRGPSILYLFNWDGSEIWRREQPAGSWGASARIINWTGNTAQKNILVTWRGIRPGAVYDGYGNVIDETGADLKGISTCYGMCADIYGDSRDEIILFDRNGYAIYANSSLLPMPSLCNYTMYAGT